MVTWNGNFTCYIQTGNDCQVLSFIQQIAMLSLDLEASCGWKWRDSSFNLWNSWRYASPLYKPYQHGKRALNTLLIRNVYVHYTEFMYPELVKKIMRKAAQSWLWNVQWSSACKSYQVSRADYFRKFWLNWVAYIWIEFGFNHSKFA